MLNNRLNSVVHLGHGLNNEKWLVNSGQWVFLLFTNLTFCFEVVEYSTDDKSVSIVSLDS